MEWLARPLIGNGVVVAGPLDPARLTDADLLHICLRMHVVLNTIEIPRCEGRLMPRELFDAIDTLESMALHGHRGPDSHHSPPRLVEWAGVIRDFGAYYGLAGSGPIDVNEALFRDVASRYGWAAGLAPYPSGI